MKASRRTPRAWACAVTVVAAVCATLRPAPAATPAARAPANEIEARELPARNAGVAVGRGRRGQPSIQGFATDISVDQGSTVAFKVDTPASNYRLDIYRMGWYGGAGARLVATVQPSAALPQTQPDCDRRTRPPA